MAPQFHEQAAQCRLLVVDDIADNRAILCRRFVLRGFETIEAESGRRALDLIDEEPFDAVLLDIIMPDLSGLDVLTIIRSRLDAAALPVIMVTAVSESSDVVKALALGANDYVTKPIDFAVTHARVCSHIARYRAEGALRRAASDAQCAKAVVESSVQAHLDMVEEKTTRLARTPLDENQRADVEAIRASGGELVRSIAAGWPVSFRHAA